MFQKVMAILFLIFLVMLIVDFLFYPFIVRTFIFNAPHLLMPEIPPPAPPPLPPPPPLP